MPASESHARRAPTPRRRSRPSRGSRTSPSPRPRASLNGIRTSPATLARVTRGGRGGRLRAERRRPLAALAAHGPDRVRDAGRRQPRLHDHGRARSRRSRASAACGCCSTRPAPTPTDELAMLRDLKHRYVDGLILVLAAPHRGARRRAERAAAPVVVIGAPPRARAVDTVRAYSRKRRRRRRPPPARGRPAADRVRQRPAAHGARLGAAPRLPRRAALVRARARRRADARSPTTSWSSPAARAAERLLDARDAGRDPLRQRPARGRRARGAARCRARRARATSRVVGHGQHAPRRAHLAGADDGRPRLGRARAASRPSCCSSGSRSPARRAAHRRRRAAPRRARLVREPPHERPSPRPRPLTRRRGRGRAAAPGVGLSGREAMLLLIPALLPIVILSVLPLARGIYLGFTDSQAGLGVADELHRARQLPRADPRRPLHQLVQDRPDLGGRRDGDRVLLRARPRAPAQPAAARAAGSPARSRSSRGRCRR